MSKSPQNYIYPFGTPGMHPLASIIIDNYNYGHFIREAIDSALAQTYPELEVIVVDDGSTDDSREMIASYGRQIISVCKENGGQASAFNAGYSASHGKVICFLDSDDMLFPSAIENAVEVFTTASGSGPLAKVQWPLVIVDEAGVPRGDTKPPQPPPEGDFRDVVLEKGPTSCISAPTSGNAWSRQFLDWAMPAPENVAYYRLCADEYLYTMAPVFGPVRTIAQSQGSYRIHGQNIYSSLPFSQRLQLEMNGHAQQCQALSDALLRRGIDVDTQKWRHHSWFHRLDQAINDLRRLIPEKGQLILIDDNTLGAADALAGLRVHPFLERGDLYWGLPNDDQVAIAEFDRMRAAGATHLALAWPAFWWREHYPLFFMKLHSTYPCVLRNECLFVFDLQRAAEPLLAGA